jgi:hypothetical protein
VTAHPANANARRATGRRDGLIYDATRHRPPGTTQVELLRLIQRPFGAVFWFIERVIGRITDELERKR